MSKSVAVKTCFHLCLLLHVVAMSLRLGFLRAMY